MDEFLWKYHDDWIKSIISLEEILYLDSETTSFHIYENFQKIIKMTAFELAKNRRMSINM